MAPTLLLSLAVTGCMSPYAKRSSTLASATAPVVTQAAAVYSSANSIHSIRLQYDAVAAFDNTTSVYNPRTIQPLMSDKDIQVRVTVLAAFQAYVQSLVAVTSGTDSPQLQAAARSAGEDIKSLGSTLAPSIDATFNIATAPASTTSTTVTATSGNTTTATTTTKTTAAKSGNPITPEIQNGISTAIDAFAQFLINQKVKKELPKTVEAMDPNVTALCNLLKDDIAILTDQEDRDYNFIVNQQTLFIRSNASLDPEQRREQIMKLPEIVEQEQASSKQLTQLSASVDRLEAAHHALALQAKGATPESLSGKLGDLEAAGNDLGTFYSSLSAKQ